MNGIYIFSAIFILFVVYYLFIRDENFYFEPNTVGYTYDPQVALDSGMLYNPEDLYE